MKLILPECIDMQHLLLCCIMTRLAGGLPTDSITTALQQSDCFLAFEEISVVGAAK